MRKSSKNKETAKISIVKVLGWLFIICTVLVLTFLLTPYQVGPVKKVRAKVILEYVGVIKDKRSNAELIKSLNSSDDVEQLNAILTMAHRSHSPENVEALLNYLKSDDVSDKMKNFAVWALGELRAREAKEFLYSLNGKKNIDQYEVEKAIKKIEGKIQKPFWRK